MTASSAAMTALVFASLDLAPDVDDDSSFSDWGKSEIQVLTSPSSLKAWSNVYPLPQHSHPGWLNSCLMDCVSCVSLYRETCEKFQGVTDRSNEETYRQRTPKNTSSLLPSSTRSLPFPLPFMEFTCLCKIFPLPLEVAFQDALSPSSSEYSSSASASPSSVSSSTPCGFLDEEPEDGAVDGEGEAQAGIRVEYEVIEVKAGCLSASEINLGIQ